MHRPLVRLACTLSILRFQQRGRGLACVGRSMNGHHADDSNEILMVDGVD